MQWFDCFDFFLFDFDGLLVDTEKLHYQAYQQMIKNRGFFLDWNFDQYCGLAHLNAYAVKEALYQQFPDLKTIPWEVLYSEKKALYLEILTSSSIGFMPGVEDLLKKIGATSKKSCVVTNSLKEHIDPICQKNPLLKNIPYWVTREDYEKAKPAPDGYLKALSLYGLKEERKERVIGFEDSLRGLKALQETKKALPVLICSTNHPQMKSLDQSVLHVESFFDLDSLDLNSEHLLKKDL